MFCCSKVCWQLIIGHWSCYSSTCVHGVCVYLLLVELVAGLRDQRLPDGTTDSVGEVLINWVWLSTAVFVCLICLLSLMKWSPCLPKFLFTRRRSFNVHAFGYNSARSERIWMKFGELRVYCLELALTDFGRNPRRSESGRPCGSFVFLSGKQRTTLRISGQPIFTKFAHKTWFCEAVNPFGNIFWKFALKGFFPKKPWSSSTISDFRPWFLGNDYKSWNRWQVGAPVECWLSIQTVGINSKSFAWPSSSVQGRTFLDISGSSV